VFNNLKDSNGASSAPSVRGARILDQASGMGPSMVAVVSGRPVDDPATRAAVEAASQKVSALPGVVSVATAYSTPDPQLAPPTGAPV
jgi:RND superfamily putative drug exporter